MGSWNFRLISSKVLRAFCIAKVQDWAANQIWAVGKWLQSPCNGDKRPGVTLWKSGIIEGKITWCARYKVCFESVGSSLVLNLYL